MRHPLGISDFDNRLKAPQTPGLPAGYHHTPGGALDLPAVDLSPSVRKVQVRRWMRPFGLLRKGKITYLMGKNWEHPGKFAPYVIRTPYGHNQAPPKVRNYKQNFTSVSHFA